MNHRFSLARWSGLLLMAALVASIAFPIFSPVYAQSDPQTPAQLCEAAQPNIADPDTRDYDQAEQVLEPGVDYYAIFCTQQGAIYINLYEEYTPITVNNFVFLANAGYYNNTTFHRVIADFMIQGGDPLGTGTGGPGYEFEDEFVPFLTFSRPGLLAMANAGPATNGSQFFITRVPTPHLDGRHTIFGEVLEGQAVVENMQDRDPATATEVGDALYTVLIITDPAAVETTYELPAVFTAEEAYDQLLTIVGEEDGLTPAEGQTGLFTSAEEAAVRFESAADWYGLDGFAYEATAFWQISQCPSQSGLLGVGLTMMDWTTSENAAGALNDTTLPDLQTAQGFGDPQMSDVARGPLFSKALSDICDTAGTYHRFVITEGRYLLMVDVVIEDGVVPDEDVPAVMENFAGLLEGLVGNIILIGLQNE